MKRLLAALVLLAFAAPAPARTIVVTDQDTERMAVIAPAAPDLSWAAIEGAPGVYGTKYTMYLTPGKAFLLALPLDAIPKGQRITRAELILPVHYAVPEQRVTIRRVLADWGPGVNYKYRRQRPKAVEWAKPGAAGAADCAPKATAVVKADAAGEKTANVTEDVELWYGGAASNHGWALTVEDLYAAIHLLSPLSTYPRGIETWKLRITYEPE